MNGYTTININGQTVGIKFGYLAIKEFSLAAEKKRAVYYDKVNGEEQLSFLGIAKIIHCGYKNDCELKEVDPVLTLEDFNNWVEGIVGNVEAQKELTRVLTVFSESQFVKAMIGDTNNVETEEAKKKIEKPGSRKLKAAS
jgi:hypothetical protein